MTGFSPFHSFAEVIKVTKHTDNTVFNKVGDSASRGNFRITLWSKDLVFDIRGYIEAQKQLEVQNK